MHSGIYKIVNQVNGEVYVGSAVNFESRWKAHIKALKRVAHHAPRLQHDWNKYGPEAFEFSRLLVCSKENLLMYEQIVLDNMDVAYNTCKVAGSRLGVSHTVDTRNKIKDASKAMWGRNREGMMAALHAAKGKMQAMRQDPEFKARHQASVRQARQLGAKTITYNGETKPVREWAEQIGVGDTTLHARMRAGWTPEEVITTPCITVNSPEFLVRRRERRNSPTYQYKGESLGLTELAAALGTNKCGLWSMIRKRGVEYAITYYAALAAGKRPKTLRNIVCEYNGAPQSLLTLSEVFSAPYVTLNRRVKRYGLEATIQYYEAKHG